jgi:hypothetical protein
MTWSAYSRLLMVPFVVEIDVSKCALPTEKKRLRNYYFG